MELDIASVVVYEKVIIKSLVVILVTSSLVALIFQRLRLALIPAYLVGGVLVGPSCLGFVKSTGALEEIGHLAVVLLLFGVGMELHLSSLRKDARVLIGTSIGSCLISCLLGTIILLFLGIGTSQSVVLAMGFSLSSTALVLRLLSSSRELMRGHGQLSLAILVTQDLAVLLMLALIPALANWDSGTMAEATGLSSSGFFTYEKLLTAMSLVAIFVAGQKILPRFLSESLRAGSSEVLMISAVAVTLLVAYSTQQMGFSLEMGAFLVGFLLASSPLRHHLAGQIAPLRDLFMAIFFTTLGMELDLGIVSSNLLIILVACGFLVIFKCSCIFASAWIFGVHSRIAMLSAVILSQAGEFSLIVFSKAGDYSILSDEMLSIVTGVVVISLVVTPALFLVSKKLAILASKVPAPFWVRKRSFSESEEKLLSCTGEHIVVAGYGPAGRQIVEVLSQYGIPYTVVELNRATVESESKKGVNILFGDISNEAVLSAVHIDQARSLIITFPDPEVAVKAAAKARMSNSDIEIVARASSTFERKTLERTEIDDAVVDEELSAKVMVELAHRMSKRRP